MSLNKKLITMAGLLASTMLSTFGAVATQNQYNFQSDVIKTFYFTPSRANLFEADGTDAANLRLSRDQIRRIIRADVEKVQNTYANSSLSSKGTRRDTDAVTDKIMWAAECTGNDPIVLASIIGNESSYCFFTESLSGGGDSGCGQFTSTAIRTLKKATGNASEEVYRQVTEPVQAMAEQCSRGSSYINENTMKEFFSKSIASIKADLVSGKNLSLDIMSSAIFLKILYASSDGVYYDLSANKRAIWKYNGGGVKNYSNHVYVDKACVLSPQMSYCPTVI